MTHRGVDTSPGRGVGRRRFLEAGVVAGLGLATEGPGAAPLAGQAPAGAGSSVGSPAAAYDDNVYTRLLGVRPHLGAHEHISRLGGARMSREVLDAMAEANEYFVDIPELMEAAGRRVARLIGAEAALITSGGFSGMLLGAAACLAGSDPGKIEALPHPTWPRRECLIQSGHRFGYDRAYRAAGMTIVEASTRDELLARISERTAMIAVLPAALRQGQFGPPVAERLKQPVPPEILATEELVAIGQRHRVPVLVDPASEIPPWDNLSRFFAMGADLVTLSGGKAIEGPQSTGILAGRADLVEAARLNAFPNGQIGRGMKIDRGVIVGLVVALERFVARDHAAVEAAWNRKAKWIADQLIDIPGLRAEYARNTSGYYDVDLRWDPALIPLTEAEVRARLKSGSPPLVYDGTTVRTRNLRDGEEVLVAKRLKDVFESARR